MENESLKQYYINTHKEMPDDLIVGNGRLPHINIIKQQNCLLSLAFMRRDYYKIVLTKTKALLETENGEILIDRPAVFFSSPDRLFGWTYLCESKVGYTVLFNDAYLHEGTKDVLHTLLSLFTSKEYPFLFLDDNFFERFYSLFQMIWEEFNSSFSLKKNLINNLLVTIFYTAIEIKNVMVSHSGQVSSIFNDFSMMLERQFPIDAPNVTIAHKSPKDFAQALGIHVNYLNALVKQQTGKTTSEVIGDRLLSEAKNLLRHSSWSIIEIANCLGYGYGQHFHYFFKRRVGMAPRAYRKNI
ncbi:MULTISPECIES: helix-turn-helix domain-containing protein [Chitinophagaceae]